MGTLRSSGGGAKESKGLPRPRQAARPQGCGLRHSSAKMVRRICSSTPLFLEVEVMTTVSVGIDLAQERLRHAATKQAKEFDVAHGLVFFAGLNAFGYLQLPEFFRLPGTGKSLHSLGRNRALIANMELVVSSAVCLRHWTAQWSKYNFPTKVLRPTKTSQPKHPRYSA